MNSDKTTVVTVNRNRLNSRKKIAVSADSIVKSRYLDPESRFPLIMEPQIDDLDLATWLKANRELVEAQLLAHTAILFRNFNINSIEGFYKCARSISPELLQYNERAAPRQELQSGIYTSTEFPADQYIPMHHEMAYSHNWPLKIMFFCNQPAEQGGCTPIVNDRKFWDEISPAIKEPFIAKKIMYVRNYGEGVDISWQDAFQTRERSVVEEYCRSADISLEWRIRGRLRTKQVRHAVMKHPITGDTVWFNHSHLFHMSNLEPAVREALLEEFRDDELPRNAFYGDGSTIPSEVLDEIRRSYDRAAVRFTWQKGDLLLLDNVLASHGRDSFSGKRQVLVAMGQLCSSSGLVGAGSPTTGAVA